MPTDEARRAQLQANYSASKDAFTKAAAAAIRGRPDAVQMTEAALRNIAAAREALQRADSEGQR